MVIPLGETHPHQTGRNSLQLSSVHATRIAGVLNIAIELTNNSEDVNK